LGSRPVVNVRQRAENAVSPGRRSTRVLRPLHDRIGPATRVLFVGINPGIRSAETGHHFAGYSNRFWKLLHESGLVPERLTFERDADLPRWGFGITNIVGRPTPGVGDLEREEFERGRRRLLRKLGRIRPQVVAVVGVTVFRALVPRRRRRGRPEPVSLGPQPEMLAGARVFVLPNPSGRNANYSYAEMLDAFRALRRFLRRDEGKGSGIGDAVERPLRVRALGREP
jgi:TDG/mug DNA glycosylase family protein